MNRIDAIFLKRINTYAQEVLDNIDPQKVPISEQLEKLKPIMITLATEENVSLQDTFIRYMDLASEFALQNETDFHSKLRNQVEDKH